MLVATAAVGLVAPIAAQASDSINLEGMNDYNSSSSSKRFDSNTFVNEVNEDIAVIKGRLDGLEARQSNFEAGSFSDTTTLDGKAIFTLGAVEYDESANTRTEAVGGFYTYTMNLNTSFTGDDNLYVRIKTGNHTGWSVNKDYGSYLVSGNTNSSALKVDKIWYEFPVGDNNTVWVGPKIENYYMHGATPSIYQPVTKQFTLGGNGLAYGASTDTGFGWAYQGDGGFSVSSNVGTKSLTTDGATGLLTEESKTSWATQIGYTKPSYSGSVIVNVKSNGWSDGYYASAGDAGSCKSGKTCDSFTSIGLRGWWRPENAGTATPAISVGYDTTTHDNNTSASETSDAYFVGLNWMDIFQADDKIGVAFGQPNTNEDETVDPFAYEAYYSFKPNDSVTVTPAIFGGSDRNGTAGADIFGTVLETTFKF